MKNQLNIDKRRAAYSLVIAIGLAVPAFCMLVLPSWETRESLPCLGFLFGHRLIAGCILSAAAFLISAPLSYIGLSIADTHTPTGRKSRSPEGFWLSFRPLSIAAATLVIMLCWSPYFFMYYPGITTGFDTISQLYQYLSPPPTLHGFTGTFVDVDFLDDNPVLTTVAFGVFVRAGRMLGSDTLGIFAYGLFQACLTAFSFAMAICYFERLKIARPVRIGLLVIVCLLPVLPIAAFSMIKDSLFSVFFMLYTLCYIEVFRTRGKSLRSIGFVIVFIALACLSWLSKTTGAYVVTLSGIVLVIAVRGHRAQGAIAAIAPFLVCSLLIPATVYPALNVGTPPPTGASVTGEYICYQQCITVFKEHPEALESMNDQDRKTIDTIFDVERALADYDPSVTDGVAKAVRKGVTAEENSDFLKLWASLGLRYPKEYIASEARVVGGLVIPSSIIEQEQGISQLGIDLCSDYATSVGNEFHLDAANPPENHALAERFLDFYTNVLGVIPGISLLLTSGLYGGWIPFISLMMVFYCRKRDVAALAPILFTSLFLLVCPSPLARYIIPSVYIAPLAIGWMLYTIYRPHENDEATSAATHKPRGKHSRPTPRTA